MQSLKILFSQNLQEQVKQLLEACIQSFSFDSNRDTIPLICGLFFELCGSQTFPDLETPQDDPFIQKFCSFRECFNAYKECQRNGQGYDIPNLISDQLLSGLNLERTSMTSFQVNFLKAQKTKLIELKQSLQEEIEKTKDSKKQKELQKELLKQLPAEKQLKNRNHFIKGETIPFEESLDIEFKDYVLPLSEQLEYTLAKTINSYMNLKGGRIYIGIKDDKVIKGIRLTSHQKHNLESLVQNLVSHFEPQVKFEDQIKIQYIPVLNSNDKAHIMNLYVAKIIVKQGDPRILYSIKKEGMECYLRFEGASKVLSSAETREKLIEMYFNPGEKVSDEEFEDKFAEGFSGNLLRSDEESKIQDWEEELV